MAIKLDENLSRHLTSQLREQGHDAVHVEDEGLLSQPDAVVAAAASREGRMLFTLDLGFADLRRYPPGQHPNIVLFRPRSLGPRAVQDAVVSFLHSVHLAEIRGCIVVVEPHRVRVRRPKPEN